MAKEGADSTTTTNTTNTSTNTTSAGYTGAGYTGTSNSTSSNNNNNNNNSNSNSNNRDNMENDDNEDNKEEEKDILHREASGGGYDSVVTCFFIDTAPVSIDYLETIHHALRPGGVWVNFGPLLYHWRSDSEGNQVRTNELSYALTLIPYNPNPNQSIHSH